VEIAAIAGGVVVAFAIAGLAIWLVPRRQVAGWRRAGITDEQKLAELGMQARTSIVQALGGLALIVTLAITISQVNETRKSAERAQRSADNNLRVTERGQVAERFSRSVEQLGSSATDVRTGGLFSLLRITRDSPEYAEPVFLIAATYVREHYRSKRTPADGCKAPFDVSADISTALRFVLPRIAPALLEGRAADARLPGLRGASLDGLAIDNLALRRFDLDGVRFRNASLQDADFRGSNLTDAKFGDTCLNLANFRDAKLDRADFRGARMKRANFRDASLKGAIFTAAGAAEAELTPAQRSGIVVVPDERRTASSFR
jgi:hypothetical protein